MPVTCGSERAALTARRPAGKLHSLQSVGRPWACAGVPLTDMAGAHFPSSGWRQGPRGCD